MSGIVLCEYGDCKTTSIDKSDGEMTYCNRKGKHMFFYEIELRVKWAAEIDEKKITGQIRCPSICDEEPISSMEVMFIYLFDEIIFYLYFLFYRFVLLVMQRVKKVIF